MDLREQGRDAYMSIRPKYFKANGNLPRDGAGEFFPLSDIPGRTIVYCSEAGPYTIYKSDRWGFNNPDESWRKPLDVAMVGDSYTQGACVEGLRGRVFRINCRLVGALFFTGARDLRHRVLLGNDSRLRHGNSIFGLVVAVECPQPSVRQTDHGGGVHGSA